MLAYDAGTPALTLPTVSPPGLVPVRGTHSTTLRTAIGRRTCAQLSARLRLGVDARLRLSRRGARSLIDTRRATQRLTHIVDIATRPGRYQPAVLATADRGGLSALCRDLDPAGQGQGRAPRPQIVLAAGIDEPLTDAEAIRRSMRGVRALLANTLPHCDGAPRITGVRALAAVEIWARGAGFATIRTVTKSNGIFAVTIAAARA